MDDWLTRPYSPPPGPYRGRIEDLYAELDKSSQVLALDVSAELSDSVEEAPLKARLDNARGGMVSAGVLASKAKIFDDGLTAAVELAADQGCGKLKGRNELLKVWLQASQSPRLWAALQLRGGVELGRGGEEKGLPLASQFLLDPARAQPLGFYNWSPMLEGIFRRDRFLQDPLSTAELKQLREGLLQCGALDDYRAQLRLIARLTNPLSQPRLDSASPEAAVLPASRTVEAELGRRVLGDRQIREGFDLTGYLMNEVEKGKLTLRPSQDSGWYAHQQWCLESLLHDRENLEKAKLLRGPGYQQALRDLCRSLLALTRETHIKQVEFPSFGCAADGYNPRLIVRPSLRVEPLVTFYQRRAQSYDFVRSILEESLGQQGLSSLHRFSPRGPVEMSLRDELTWMSGLFRGCAQIAADDLGLGRQLASAIEVQAGIEWLSELSRDNDLSQDIRCMVPLFYDKGRDLTKVLAVVGYSERPLDISFVQKPGVIARDSKGMAVEAEIEFESSEERLIYPVAVEIYVSKVIPRLQFQSLCDAHSTLGSLRAALSG